MRTSLRILIATGAVLLASAGGLALDDAAVVTRAELTFAVRDHAASVKGSLRLEGKLPFRESLPASFLEDGAFSFTLGGAVLVDSGTAAGPVAQRRRARGDTVVTVRRAFDGRGKFVLRIFPESGWFTLKARGFDASSLLAGGPAALPFVALLGGALHEGTAEFTALAPRRWICRHRFVPRPPPGGGGTGGGGSGGGGGGSGGALSFSSLEKGAYSAFGTPQVLVVRDASTWQQVWNAHHANEFPVPPLPAVDFSREMVVGAWVGTRGSGGYTATITGITAAPGSITVAVREDRPGTNCGGTSAINQPFHLVRTARADGVAAMQVTVNVYTCP